MKKIILSIFCVIISLGVSAQFTSSGSNLQHSANNTTLSIIPEGNSTGTHIASGQNLNLIFNDNSAGTDFFTIRSGGNTFSSSAEHLRINHLGNVGIGLSNPASRLEVGGDISLSRAFKIKFLETVSGGDRAYIKSTNGENGDYNSLIFAIGGGTESMMIKSNGRVGIGTLNPSAQLDVNGTVQGTAITSKSSVSVFSNEAGKQSRRLTLNTGDGDNSYIYNYDQSSTTFHTVNIGGSHSLQSGITILGNGHVGIGTTSTGSHKLAVEGSIGARSIKVEATGWSDFVFEDDYKLRSLEETEQFISSNKHLPEIPSEKEVVEKGINLGEMDAKLLQKIEELTLHMIDMNKRVHQLEAENKALKNKVGFGSE